MKKVAALALGVSMVASSAFGADADIYDQVRDGYATNGDVKIHYAELGSGPPVVFIHGFPDFWYSWRHQMKALADAGYRAVAIDQRGYNLSDKPEGVAAYAMPNLVGDVVAVIRSLGVEKATVVGHDWGGAVAWQVALNAPQVVDKLIILNLPHPMGMSRELATNPEQQQNSAYARAFQTKSASDPDVFFGMPLRPETMSGWVTDPEAKKRYLEAFQRTDLDATLNYYKANYPREPYDAAWNALQENPIPKVKMPVLQFHGLNDTALNARGLNDTWSWLEKDLTLVTVPGAGHFVQQDAPELVSETMRWWLDMRRD
ncbi:MAG TPA: alpha/beta hydrolase [Thermoanaerobaculia bacterium]|nr:alpha/beta hydrolase [Thermoanaerobaculia bacterium]